MLLKKTEKMFLSLLIFIRCISCSLKAGSFKKRPFKTGFFKTSSFKTDINLLIRTSPSFWILVRKTIAIIFRFKSFFRLLAFPIYYKLLSSLKISWVQFSKDHAIPSLHHPNIVSQSLAVSMVFLTAA